MIEFDKITGLPKEISDFGQIAKETQKIKIRVVRRRFRKIITLIIGLEDEKNARELIKTLKRKLACGGTVKENNEIELQGDHKKKVKETLIKEGYKEEFIDD